MSRARLILRRLLPRARVSPTLRPLPHRRAAGTMSIIGRPQLPFLAPPSPRQQTRYMGTGRRNWLVNEAYWTVYWCFVFGTMSIFGWAIAFAVREEVREREHPTPHEWSFITRWMVREAMAERDVLDTIKPDWPYIFQRLRDAARRLEDGKVDGKNVNDMEMGQDPPHPPESKDLSAKGEEWIRGYYEVLMAWCKAAEYVDGWVVDKTRGIVFAPEVVIGPSNPNRKPIPVGAASAPKEEDCELAFPERPDMLYQKVLGTKGFTPRQRMDAALAYATWLEFKGEQAAAGAMYEQAVGIALDAAGQRDLVDPEMWTLKDSALPSANALRSLTAYAQFKARQGDTSSGLPMMVSILRARRSLPSVGAALEAERTFKPRQITQEKWFAEKISDLTVSFFSPPPYPPPPPDGTRPPARDAKERCEEAALHMHIGEIMYASSARAREEGLAWTREAVDTAEEQLHQIQGEGAANKNSMSITSVVFGTARRDERDLISRRNVVSLDARTTCRECLAAGLDNWALMVRQLAAEEQRQKEKRGEEPSSGGSWFGLWGRGGQQAGRWEAEEKVVEERMERAKKLLDDPDAPSVGPMSLFQV
ncbi:hypothetical protein MCOR27_009146 [Pyricularia oryzae]|uniref:Mfs maltose permease n=2 Tax=Pyricularia TaxID=48558 RepID=A0ABQ8P108_PYRGI|nr:hypothetical protein MCOR01_009998 [Pyricularia oryzae]KAI6304719.1 hypothetical protein MCOR33_000238 [Pyricularia grisea]KAH9436686.1 hypothetical protein MCOR02_000355 [Pyricularia oryzae]KAI6259000.1 hypothetical protein MCOR19_004652 [Pyricularia oryzae]KAI6270744.1 hypothetical protein MCOR27_009146 [Pyricularia oryzae]